MKINLKINVYVEFMLFQNKDKLNVNIEEGSNIIAILDTFQMKAEDYFYVVNGINKMKTYILKDGDHIKIFTVINGG